MGDFIRSLKAEVGLYFHDLKAAFSKLEMDALDLIRGSQKMEDRIVS